MPSALPSADPCCNPCAGLSVTVNVVAVPSGYFVVDLLADLRALPTLSSNKSAIVNGGLAVDDGNGGLYVWRNGATNLDDGSQWIKPNDRTNAQPGRWHKDI